VTIISLHFTFTSETGGGLLFYLTGVQEGMEESLSYRRLHRWELALVTLLMLIEEMSVAATQTVVFLQSAGWVEFQAANQYYTLTDK